MRFNPIIFGVSSIVVAVGLTLPAEAIASVATGGRVTAYFINARGLLLFDTDAPRSGWPSCANNTKNNFSLMVDSMQKQALFTAVVTAYHTAKPVIITSVNGCPDEATMEGLNNIILLKQ